MSDDDLYDPDDESNEGSDSRDFRRLRAKAEKAEADLKEAQAKLDKAGSAERDLAFLRAGIDPDSDPKLKAFMKTYDGEMTVEAIKEAAMTDGWIKAEAPDPALVEANAAAQVSAGAGVETPASQEAEHLAAILNAPDEASALEAARQAGVKIKDPLDQ